MKKVVKKSKQAVSNRSTLELILLGMLILIFYLLLASRYEWWPWNVRHHDLGTAFYANSRENAVDGTREAIDSANREGQVGNGSHESDAKATENNSTQDLKTSRLIVFAGKVNIGMSKNQLSAIAEGLGERCTVIANSSNSGKQEVCIYAQRDKIITVTLLNDRVVSASRSGF